METDHMSMEELLALQVAIEAEIQTREMGDAI